MKKKDRRIVLGLEIDGREHQIVFYVTLRKGIPSNQLKLYHREENRAMTKVKNFILSFDKKYPNLKLTVELERRPEGKRLSLEDSTEGK